ncbi:EAL domain-containing protein [Pseudoalteromonas sp.]|uniref:EAL domain-containing protein n=1 Tax=Pseudoalteromonas sp. TaxID=53249 RepID=UPI00356192A9
MISLSIRTKIISITFAVTSLCAILITVLTLYQHQQLYSQQLMRNLQALGKNLADELFPLVVAEQPDEIELTTTLMQLERYNDIKYGAITNRSNNILAEYVSKHFISGIKTHPKWSKNVISNSDLHVEITVGEADSPLGKLIIIADTREQLSLDNKAFLHQLVPLVIATIIIVLFISNWVQSRLITPLISLSKLAQSVSETKNYSLRSRVEGNDEIAQLAININEMLSIINNQDLENKRHTTKLLKQQQSLKNFANFDQLTGLPNRKLFSELLKQALLKSRRHNMDLAVMFLDLDNFKTVNDSLGHHAGDDLLIKVSERMKKILREEDVLARVGGDEFIIVLTDLPNQKMAITIAERLINCFTESFEIKEWKVHSGVSIGIAFNEGKVLDATSLIRDADAAMYRAKECGRNQFAVFEKAMQGEQHRHMLIANELTKAIKNQEFKLFYQAKVCPKHGVVGLEALIRWQSTFDGWISPAEFISVAEHVGKVHYITRWVIEQGLKDVTQIAKLTSQRIVTSFNVSAIDVSKPEFIYFIEQHLKQNNVSAELVEFEVTETSYLENFDASSKFFNALNELGCSIALDDFGTGYSSLSYLTQVKANTLKIDQQFISKMFDTDDDRMVVESIVSLAKKLNLKVCAEGVEEHKQFEFVTQLGCDLIQGYYFAKPVPLNELTATIADIHSKHQFQLENNKVVPLKR